jgi:uncharacterized protein (UPF0210 family)
LPSLRHRWSAKAQASRTTSRWGRALDPAAQEVGVDFIGGFSALVHKETTRGDGPFPEAPLKRWLTARPAGSVNVAGIESRLNMDAVVLASEKIKAIAARARQRRTGLRQVRRLANAVEDNPSMAGAFMDWRPEVVINIGARDRA